VHTLSSSCYDDGMQVVVVARAPVLAPLGLVVDACALGDGTFADARADALRRCGLTPPAHKHRDDDMVTGPALVVADDLWITRRALASFLRATRTSIAPTRLRLPPSRLLELTLPLQDVVVDEHGATFACAFVPAGHTIRAGDALDAAAATTIPYKELLTTLPVPRTLVSSTHDARWPLTSTVVLRVRHWLHVLRASHLAPQVWLLERALRDPVRSAWRALLGLRTSSSAREAAWKRQFVFVGKRAQIHPTAIVEGSIIGDDVVIGPGSMVLQSIVGAGTRIEQRAHISQSTIGRRNFISLNSSMQACVTFDDADPCANNLQACVVGPRAGLTSFVRALDTALHDDGRPAGPVFVVDGTARRSVGELPCGACFGADTYVGAEVSLAAGRALPAGVRVVTAPSSLLRRLPDDVAAGTWVVEDGSLVPLRTRR
jgi:hypothetical protein